MLNSRDPQAPTLTVLGSQGRLSTATELMDWFTTPVLKVALMPLGWSRMGTVVWARTGPPWHCEHLAGPKKASRPRCRAAVIANRSRFDLYGSGPGRETFRRL